MRMPQNGAADHGLPGRSDSRSAATSGAGNVSSPQADGHVDPLRDNCRSYLNTALQILELSRARLTMSLGRDGLQGLEAAIVSAKAAHETEVATWRQAALVRRPDPAHVDALVEMEKTNRELGLAGDALAAELEGRS